MSAHCDDPGTPHGPHVVDRGPFGVRRCPGVSAPTPPERVCRWCGARDNLRVIIDVLGATYKSWECRGGCPTPEPADVIDARADHARMTDAAEGLSVALTRVTRERDAARAELDQWRAAYGESALPGALNLMKQRTRERDEARAEADRLRELIAELYDDGPCQYDHHDQCQGHNLDRRPCPHARAAALFADGGDPR